MTFSFKNTNKILALSFGVAYVFSSFNNNLHASDLGIKPPDQQYSIQAVVTPGQKFETYVEILNTNKSETKTGTILAKDLLVQDDGGFNVIGTDQENQDVAKWINVSQSIVDVPAGGLKKVPLSINVPNDAKSGEYVAGLTIMDNQPESQLGNVKIVSRVAIQVHLAVVGDLKINSYIQDLGITKLAGKEEIAGLYLNTKNEGNLATKSNINMVLKGPENFKLDKNLDSYFFPSAKNHIKPLQMDYTGWKDGKYEMVLDMVNNPINRQIKDQDLKYVVKKQHMVINFDYNKGVVSNLKIVENKKWDTLEPKADAVKNKNNLFNLLLVGLSLLGLIFLVFKLQKNKLFAKKKYQENEKKEGKIEENSVNSHPSTITNKTYQGVGDVVKNTEEKNLVEQNKKVKYNNVEEEKTEVLKEKHTIIGNNKNKTIYDKTEKDKNHHKISL